MNVSLKHTQQPVACAIMQAAAAAVQDELVAVTARLQSAQQALQVEQVGSPLQVADNFDCNAVQCTGAESSGA